MSAERRKFPIDLSPNGNFVGALLPPSCTFRQLVSPSKPSFQIQADRIVVGLESADWRSKFIVPPVRGSVRNGESVKYIIKAMTERLVIEGKVRNASFVY